MSMCKELQGSQKKETQQAFKGKQEEKKKKKPTCKTTKVTNFLVICSWRNNSLFRTEPSSPHLQKSALPESGILVFCKIISKGQEIKPSFTLGSKNSTEWSCYFVLLLFYGKMQSVFYFFALWDVRVTLVHSYGTCAKLHSLLCSLLSLCWLYSLFTLYSLFSAPFCHLQY